MWDHVVKCKCSDTINLRKEFIEKLLLQLLRNKGDINVNEIMLFCDDVLQHLENEDEEE